MGRNRINAALQSSKPASAHVLLGAKLARVAPGECVIEFPFEAELTEQHAYFHGGIVGTISDSSAFALMSEDSSVCRGLQNESAWPLAMANCLSHAAVCCNRRTLVARVDVEVVKGGRETLRATLREALMTMHERRDT